MAVGKRRDGLPEGSRALRQACRRHARGSRCQKGQARSEGRCRGLSGSSIFDRDHDGACTSSRLLSSALVALSASEDLRSFSALRSELCHHASARKRGKSQRGWCEHTHRLSCMQWWPCGVLSCVVSTSICLSTFANANIVRPYQYTFFPSFTGDVTKERGEFERPDVASLTGCSLLAWEVSCWTAFPARAPRRCKRLVTMRRYLCQHLSADAPIHCKSKMRLDDNGIATITADSKRPPSWLLQPAHWYRLPYAACVMLLLTR